MVQTVFAPDGDVTAEQIWKDIGPEQLMDSKLKCVFEMPPEQDEVHEETMKTNKIPVQATPPNNVEGELQKAAAEVSAHSHRTRRG